MIKFALEAPWNTFHKMVKALFESDSEVTISEIYDPDNGVGTYAFDIEVANHEKYLALNKVFPRVKQYGNVTLQVFLYDSTDDSEDGPFAIFSAIFQGNRAVKDIKTVTDQAGSNHYYVRFWPEVIQFYDDDLRDYNGNWSGLAQDIARDVFEDSLGVNFCTASVKENKVEKQ